MERPMVGLVSGPAALGVLGREWSTESLAAVAAGLGCDSRELRIGEADDLAALWDCDIVVLACDGAYPEVGGGVTLGALHQWCVAGGVLVEPAASAFLLASEPGGLVPSVRTFIDVFDLVIDYTCIDQYVIVTSSGREVLDNVDLPRRLLDLNCGSERRATLNSIPGAEVVHVRTRTGACVMGEYRVGTGWLVRWGAAANGARATLIRGALLRRAIARVQARRSTEPAPVVIGRRVLENGDRHAIALWAPQPTSAMVLLDDARLGAPVSIGPWVTAIPTPELVDLVAEVDVRTPLGAGHALVFAPHVQPDLPDSPTPTPPSDLLAFWTAQRAGRPLAWHLSAGNSIRARRPDIVIKRVTCDVPGRPSAWGTMAYPPGAEQRPRPAVLVLPGYACAGDEEVPERFAELGLVGMAIGFGDTPCCGAPSALGLLSQHPDDRERFGYRDVVLLCLAAVDMLATSRLVDARGIGVVGASQGGGLAVIAAALDKRVTAMAALVPYLCDLMRSQQVVATEPSAELNRWLHAHPGREPAVRSAAQYYDASNFAPWVTVPALVMCAERDELVHREAVEELSSRFPIPPTLVRADEGHIAAGLLHHRVTVERWLLEQLALATKARALPGAAGGQHTAGFRL